MNIYIHIHIYPLPPLFPTFLSHPQNPSSLGILDNALFLMRDPGIIFREYVDMTTTTAPSDVATVVGAEDPVPPPRYTLLLKREGEGNLWHCLMEIMTMTLTVDVLRMARAAAAASAGPPFFAVPDSVSDTQVVILDDRPDGPYFDLWRLFAGRAPVRLRDVLRDPATARAWAATPQTLVVPLAGAANPLWQNDWTAPLLRVFAQRVLAHYGVTGPSSSSTTKAGDEAWTLAEGTGGEGGGQKTVGKQRRLRLALIDRAASRRLAHGAALLRAVRRRFPDGAGDDVVVEAVDFAVLSFADQLRTARATDVLVSVHGAGLTHALFLRPGAGAVVEVAPPSLNHKGFCNLARMRGLHYFSLRGAIAGDVAGTTTTTTLAAAAAPSHDPGDEEEDNAQSKTPPSRRRRQLGGGDAVVRRDWHSDDLMVEEQAFVDVVVEAIAALRQGPPST